MSEVEELRKELGAIRSLTGGGLREKPCHSCGSVVLGWYDFCPSCGRELPVIPSDRPGRIHVVLSGLSLCGHRWDWLRRKYPSDLWIPLRDRKDHPKVDCPSCKQGLKELGPL
jgi:hypothetical protein